MTWKVLVPTLPILLGIIFQLSPSFRFYNVHLDGGVIVSGASRGIGYAAAKALAEKGYTVFAGVRSLADFDRITKEGNSKLVPVLLDVTDQQSIDESFEYIQAQLKQRGDLPLAGLVNNAGVQHLRILECMDADTLRWLFDVNVFGLVSLTQRFLPLLRRYKGRVINIGSIAGFAAVPLYGPYAATKHAVEAISDSLRQELMESGVAVSLIQAGAIQTDMASRYVNGVKKAKRDQTSIQADHSKECSEAYPEILDVADDLLRTKAERTWPVNATSDAIIHALTSTIPRPRYCVAGIDGLPCWLIKLMYSFFPEQLTDSIISSGSTKHGAIRKFESWIFAT